MRALLPVLIAVVGLASGCASTIDLEVLQPAALAVPPNVQTLGVIDRSKAKNVGQGVLGVLEGVVTGEAIGADTEGRAAARQGLAQALALSPRFDVVQPSISAEAAESSLFETAGLDWDKAARICGTNACDGLVTLEAFDSDATTDLDQRERTETVDGRERKVRYWEAERRLRVLTSWRLYDIANRQILDDLRETSFARTWTATGDTKQQAIRNLPSQIRMVSDVAFVAGEEYGRRIAPSFLTVSRRYFGRGDDRLKAARSRVRGLDWDSAARIWRDARTSDDPKVKGRAVFNLALYHEVYGDLDRAIELAQRANSLLDKGVTRRYVTTLSLRRADEARLEHQMQ